MDFHEAIFNYIPKCIFRFLIYHGILLGLLLFNKLAPGVV
jgi:hypothetical protein